MNFAALSELFAHRLKELLRFSLLIGGFIYIKQLQMHNFLLKHSVSICENLRGRNLAKTHCTRYHSYLLEVFSSSKLILQVQRSIPKIQSFLFTPTVSGATIWPLQLTSDPAATAVSPRLRTFLAPSISVWEIKWAAYSIHVLAFPGSDSTSLSNRQKQALNKTLRYKTVQ